MNDGVVVRADQVSLGMLVSAVPRDAVDDAVAVCGVREKTLGREAARACDHVSDVGVGTVETIQTAPEPDHWSITTDRGVTTVDQTGIGSNAVPIDTDIAADLYVYGDGYSIPASLIEIDRTAQEDRSIEQGHDLGPE